MKNASFKDYLVLVRLPNLFTLPSNILVGYVIVSTLTFTLTSFVQVILLVTISILLYCVGVLLNDLYDYHIDMKERPNRPLVSGKISKISATRLATLFSIVALSLSLLVSVPTLIVGSILLCIIFGYNRYLKSTHFGPLTIAAARVMNIIMATSVGFSNIDSVPQVVILSVVLTTTFAFVSLIGFISKYEVYGFSEKTRLFLIPAILFGIIFVVVLFSVTGFFKMDSLVVLALFSAIMLKSLYRVRLKDNMAIQHAVQNMILSIIVLDSTYLAGIVGIEVGLPVLALLAPTWILAKKMYMT